MPLVNPRERGVHVEVRELAMGMRGVINTAAIAQKGNGVRFEPFNQYLMGYDAEYDKWLGVGMCRGLSVKYLVCLKNKEKFTSIVNAKSMNTFNFTKRWGVSLPAGNPLHEEIHKAAVTGNINGGDDEAFYEFMKEQYRFRHDKRRSFTDAEDMFAFATETGAYSIIDIPSPSHSMAAAGLPDKTKTFMEPNCGIVTGSKEGVLTAVESFFSHDFVQETYEMDSEDFSFTVHRFKVR